MNIAAKACNISEQPTPSYKWLLGLIMVAVLALGWRYPVLGFIVPIAMATGIAGGFIKGRWVCGNACPRGSFLDSWFKGISGNNEIPRILKNKKFRWMTMSFLMLFMVLRLSQNPSSPDHWGSVFWQMCALTTIIAIGLGVQYSARSWCSICPVGTIAGTAGKGKHLLQVSSSCKACGFCENSCPMQLEIARYRHSGRSEEQDCLKCSVCIHTCPQKSAIGWPEEKSGLLWRNKQRKEKMIPPWQRLKHKNQSWATKENN